MYQNVQEIAITLSIIHQAPLVPNRFRSSAVNSSPWAPSKWMCLSKGKCLPCGARERDISEWLPWSTPDAYNQCVIGTEYKQLLELEKLRSTDSPRVWPWSACTNKVLSHHPSILPNLFLVGASCIKCMDKKWCVTIFFYTFSLSLYWVNWSITASLACCFDARYFLSMLPQRPANWKRRKGCSKQNSNLWELDRTKIARW